jgi:photoactive yellow protein
MRPGDGERVSHGICVRCLRDHGFPIEEIVDLDEGTLARLPYGAIRLDPGGVVLSYNEAEQRLSGRMVTDVIGRNFFQEVAPCTGVRAFYGRYLDMTRETMPVPHEFEFAFTFRDRVEFVSICMLYDPGERCGLLLIRKQT